MSPRELVWSAAAAAHLLLAVLGAVGWYPAGAAFPGNVLAEYGEASGADSSYGFFAPAVSAQCRTTMTMRDATGRTWDDALLQDSSTVFGLRTATALDSFVKLPNKVQRGVAGSWAGVMFDRYPDAREVAVSVDIQMLPTMAEWRRDERPTWKLIYRGTFVRKA